MERVNALLGAQETTFEPKYLGLPTPEGRMKSERFQPIQERLGKHIAMWTEKFLSTGGKEILIKSVGLFQFIL